MQTLDFLRNYTKLLFSQLEIPDNPVELYSPVSYTLDAGGKRLRPLLTLFSCELFGGSYTDAANSAVALELLHNFTLIHDDIMDKAPLRRGRETVYKKWNTDIAILSGDVLYALACKYLRKNNDSIFVKVFEPFNNATILVCEGQQMDMNFENSDSVTIVDYIQMIKLKTAALLAACFKIGALHTQASVRDIDNIYKFGELLGIAFQLTDDLLDVYSDNEKFGKVNSGDITSNKKTFLYLKAFQLADNNQRTKLNDLFSPKMFNNNEKIFAVKKIYDELNIKEHTVKEINSYFNLAMDCLEPINIDNNIKKDLIDFSSGIVKRDF